MAKTLSRSKLLKRRRLSFLALGLIALAGATALVLTAFDDNLVFFYGPSKMQRKAPAPDQRLRLGGLVKQDSIEKVKGGARVRFVVTDRKTDVPVVYSGILPDLFREGQGVVAEGHLRKDGTFIADEVLAKHDENYMPPAVAETLKEDGHWQEQKNKK